MIYSIILLIIAVAALISAWDVPRAKLWIGSVMASYAVATGFWYAGGAYGLTSLESTHAWVTLACDWTVCFIVFLFAKERWEIWLYRLFLFSIVVSILRLSGFVQDGVYYATALEIITASALVLIGHIGRTEAVNGASHFAGGRGVYLSRVSARSPRKTPSWHEK